jgi:hypothetical protein
MYLISPFTEVLEFESSDSTTQIPAARQSRRGVAALRDDDLPKTPAFLKKAAGKQMPQEPPHALAPSKVQTKEQTVETKALEAPSLSSAQSASKKRKSIEAQEVILTEEPSEERGSKRKSRPRAEGVAEVATKVAEEATKTPEKPQSENKVKAHYPVINFQSKVSREGRTHSELLGLLMREVCDNEIRGLEDYFNKSFPDLSHRDIFLHLKTFLEELPVRVEEACPRNGKFKPELRRSERAASKTAVGGSKAEVDALRAQIEELQRYTADVGTFLDSVGLGRTTNRTPASKGGKKAGLKNDFKAVCALPYCDIQKSRGHICILIAILD